MRAWKDGRQPIIELKTVTIPRAQFPTRHQINSPIEIKISPQSTLRIGEAQVRAVCAASFPARKTKAAALASKSGTTRLETGSLSIRLVHHVYVRKYVRRSCENANEGGGFHRGRVRRATPSGSRYAAFERERENHGEKERERAASKRFGCTHLKTRLDIIPPRNISIRPGGSAGKKVKYEEQRAEK